ncbi:MAG: hypothetical protein LUH22_00650 [Bacteroides sp.]|nr:hypothetical protein [Bacteroides sp.]
MSKLTYRVSYYVLYAIFAVILVVLALFYLGGEAATPVVSEMSNPAYTDALLYLMYGLLGFAIVVTLIAFIIQFGTALKDNPVAALKSLIGVILLAIVLIVAWSMGSAEPMEIQGFDGTENRDPFWLKITDMFIYTLYFLIGANIVAMLFSGIKRRLS